MIHTISKKVAFFTMLVVMVFILAPLVAFSGGPEPGPEGDDRWQYDPPPFSGDAVLDLVPETPGVSSNLIMVDGKLEQLGNSDCSIVVNREDPLTHIGFAPNILDVEIPTCKNLHPNDLMGFTAQVPADQLEGCDSFEPIFIEIIATPKLLCMPGGDDPPTGAAAKLIVMEYVPK